MQDCEQLTKLLTESVERNHANALLSPGLDSSILASILRPEYSLDWVWNGLPDLAYARQVAERYCKHHVEIVFGPNKMAELVEQVIQIFRTFDPIEIRNSAVALAGIEWAKSDGYSNIMTGDGSDELLLATTICLAIILTCKGLIQSFDGCGRLCIFLQED